MWTIPNTIKEYKQTVDNDELKLATDWLHHAGTYPAERKLFEAEKEIWRTYEAMQGEEKEALIKNFEAKQKTIEEKQKIIEEKDRIIAELLAKLNKGQP
ncbi:MAG TPA: hypothetical protein PKD90_17760 [Phnomibacter sp.]|nr:hypothetical protein [Phnomibacter sp.]